MKSKQVLDVQQMQHLQGLGLKLDYDTLYRYVKFEDTDWLLKPFSDLNIIGISCKYIPAYTLSDLNIIGISCKYIPAYTLQDVLDALPKEIKYKDKSCWPCIDLTDELVGYYYENIYFAHKYVYREVVKIDESLIDASYRLLCWTIENGYVETNKNE